MGSSLSKLCYRKSDAPAELETTFRIDNNVDLGRHLVSIKHFNFGDVIWEECPIISAPCETSTHSMSFYNNNNFQFTCVTCFKKIPISLTCPRCFWPCCSSICSNNTNHKYYECKVLAENDTPVTPFTFGKLIYLRALLKSQHIEPEKYAQLQDFACAYSELSESLTMSRDRDVKAILEFFSELCQMEVPKNEIIHWWSIFRINNYQLQVTQSDSTEYLGELVYLSASRFSHSCSPNIGYSYFKSQDCNGDMIWKIRFHARKEIQPGDVLSHSYCPDEMIYGTIPRQMRILRRHNFICKCSRCKDKTEEGTFFQALTCPVCKKGYLLPMNMEEIIGSPWDCASCDFVMQANSVKEVVDTLKVIPYSLSGKSGPDDYTMKMTDHFLEVQTYLHRNHYLVFQCALHWLFGTNFSRDLFLDEEDEKKLNIKVFQRLNICLPLGLNYLSAPYISKLVFIAASAYAAFIFNTSIKKANIPGNLPLTYRLRVCNRISAYLGTSLEWKKMSPTTQSHKSDVKFLVEKFNVWSKNGKNMEKEIQNSEDGALQSIENLFR